MATNLYFSQKVRSEQNLVEDLMIEALKMYGQDVYYLPRDIVNKDNIFVDDVPSRFNSSYIIEMYIENTQAFDGQGDLFTKFGVEIRDQATFIVSRKRWRDTVLRYDNEITGNRPREGDLIYLALSNSMFEIMKVEHEQPFYQLNNVPVYKLQCEKFEYNDEQLNTGREVIDSIELVGYNQLLTLADSASTGFIIGNSITQTLLDGTIITGKITDYNDSDNILSVAHVGADDGNYHLFTTARISSQDSNDAVFTRVVIDTGEQLNDPGAQNNDFAAEIENFVDFSETNPFGDLEIT